MFGLFKGSSLSYKVTDKVWMSKAAKLRACERMAAADPDCLFIAWFEKTAEELRQLSGLSDKVVTANSFASDWMGKMLIFSEHYPMLKTEHALFERLNLKEIPVLSSLDEPLFMMFGGQHTIDLMKKIGMGEEEVIGHSMINKAIHNAQEKLEKQIVTERKASSQEEWFALNDVLKC